MKEAPNTNLLATPEYRRFIEDLKARVVSARLSAARVVNRGLVLLYWDIGRAIIGKQKLHDWGDSVVEMLAADLRRAFPQMSGFQRATRCSTRSRPQRMSAPWPRRRPATSRSPSRSTSPGKPTSCWI